MGARHENRHYDLVSGQGASLQPWHGALLRLRSLIRVHPRASVADNELDQSTQIYQQNSEC
jgi:hypothetical protein